MTTLREAATQALEALENLGMRYFENTGIVLHRDVYESLKSALAEEALQRLTDVSQEIEAALAEPVQEPVAWRYQDARGNYRYRGYVQGFDKEYSLLKPVPLYTAPPSRTVPLYTAPQRKPLTDDEIKKLLIEHAGMTVVFSEVDLRFARAIERAHGIK